MKKAFTLIELLIVVAIIAILAAIAVPNFLEAQTRAKVSRVASDQRSYATGLETYYLDNNAYPIHWPRTTAAVGANPTGPPTMNINEAMADAAGMDDVKPWDNVPSFAAAPVANNPIGLTTPVSYMNTYSSDAFAGGFKNATFGYASYSGQFILISPGPDGIYNLDGSTAAGEQANTNDAEYIVAGGQSLPSPFLIAGPQGVTEGKPAQGPGSGAAYTYDSTNGTASYGDVYRVK